MTNPAPSPTRDPTRNRGRTETTIVEAALAQLAEGGFQSFGINTVARRAGCDKQLIYRYFGGLDGLVDALGEALAARLQAGLARGPAPASYAELVERLALGFLDLLAGDALLRQALAWEVAGASPAAMRLAAARGAVLAEWMQAMRGDLVPPPGVDAAAINALLIGAVQQQALLAAATGTVGGIAADAAGLARLRAALVQMVRQAYSAGSTRP